MNKLLKSIFLIIIFLGFLVEIVNAQGFSPFYVKFTDADENGKIEFNLTAISCTFCHTRNQTYYIGVATIDHKTIYDPLLQIPAHGGNFTFISWKVSSGESLIYDVYLTSDFDTYYWTSRGDAFGKRFNYLNTIIIDWSKIGVNVKIAFTHLALRDDIQITAVPIPSALWLLGSGVITLGLIRKKLLTC